jgi:predicted acylesterase/phospholipase RssA
LGILTFDLKARREELFVGGPDLPVPLPLRKTVAASAAIPGIFPPLCARRGERRLLLADAGWYTAVPIEHAFAPPVEAQKVIAVSLALRICLRQARRSYWDHLSRTCGNRLLVLRPSVQGAATILPRRRDIGRLVEAGERSVDAPALARIRSWISESAGSARVS